MSIPRAALALGLAAVFSVGTPAHAADPVVAPTVDSKASVERSQRAAAVDFARRQLGKPYVWGATGPRGFDCSGLMLAAYRSVGRKIPRTTWAQLAGLRRPGKLRPGDLVFGSSHHVAMYIGRGKVIHAPAPGRRVQIASSGWHTGYATRSVFRSAR
jgi:cell wall-associated NlpC family hydrolase